jgi:hypothetical protein
MVSNAAYKKRDGVSLFRHRIFDTVLDDNIVEVSTYLASLKVEYYGVKYDSPVTHFGSQDVAEKITLAQAYHVGNRQNVSKCNYSFHCPSSPKISFHSFRILQVDEPLLRQKRPLDWQMEWKQARWG